MNVIIRTDASRLIGTGHVMRCLALADALRARGAAVRFICRALDGDLRELIAENDYQVTTLVAPAVARRKDASSAYETWLGVTPQEDAQESLDAIRAFAVKPDWLIVDHYALDADWEAKLRASVDRILVIDDLADRRHDCDVLVDQNPYADADSRYRGKVPNHCRLLLGPRHALLREEFRAARLGLKVRCGTVRSVLVFFGGVDAANVTMVALEALSRAGLQGIQVDVVVGARQRNRAQIEAVCVTRGFACHVQTTHMAELMSAADLAIGAGGSASWERCCLGLPCLTYAVAANQSQLVRDAALAGLLYAPDIGLDDCAAMERHVRSCIENPALLAAISRRALAVVDGRGTHRVLRAMGLLSISVRQAVGGDCNQVFHWRNHPQIRQVSRDSVAIDPATHATWFESVLADPSRPLLIGEAGGQPVGVVRFDIVDGRAEVSIYSVPGREARGLGAELLLAAENWLARARPQVQCLHAEVFEGNLPSHRVFDAAGYRVSVTGYTKRLQ